MGSPPGRRAGQALLWWGRRRHPRYPAPGWGILLSALMHQVDDPATGKAHSGDQRSGDAQHPSHQHGGIQKRGRLAENAQHQPQEEGGKVRGCSPEAPHISRSRHSLTAMPMKKDRISGEATGSSRQRTPQLMRDEQELGLLGDLGTSTYMSMPRYFLGTNSLMR